MGGGGGGGTPAPTNEEKMLAEMAGRKYDLAKTLTGGSDYLTKMSKVDNTARYEEKALADTAAIMASQKETPLAPVTGPKDLRTNIAAAMAGKAQSELDMDNKKTALANNNLGVVAAANEASAAEAARKMQLEQAQREAEANSKAGLVNMLGTVGGAYATNYKRVNSAVKNAFDSTPAYNGSRDPTKTNFRGSI